MACRTACVAYFIGSASAPPTHFVNMSNGCESIFGPIDTQQIPPWWPSATLDLV